MEVQIAPGPLPVRVPADELVSCLDILLDNVFAHTGEATAFSVRVAPRAAGGAWLVISDDGPGFAVAGQTRRGHSGTGSTGLGLDIARRIAQRSGGTLTLGRSADGGAVVTVALGPAYCRERRQRRPLLPRMGPRLRAVPQVIAAATTASRPVRPVRPQA